MQNEDMESHYDRVPRAVVASACWRLLLCACGLCALALPFVEGTGGTYTMTGATPVSHRLALPGLSLLFGHADPLVTLAAWLIVCGIGTHLMPDLIMLVRCCAPRAHGVAPEQCTDPQRLAMPVGIGMLLWQAGLTILLCFGSRRCLGAVSLEWILWMLLALHTLVGPTARHARSVPLHSPGDSGTWILSNALRRIHWWLCVITSAGLLCFALAWDTPHPVGAPSTLSGASSNPPGWTRRGYDLVVPRFIPSVALLHVDAADQQRALRILSGVVLILWWSLFVAMRSVWRRSTMTSQSAASREWYVSFLVQLLGLALWSDAIRLLLAPTDLPVGPIACAALFILCGSVTLLFGPWIMWCAIRRKQDADLVSFVQEA